MKFSIPVNTVKALLSAAGKQDIRYYLNGICLDIRSTDSVAVATNGHILLALPIVPVDDDSPRLVGQFIVPRALLEQVKPAKNADVIIEIFHGTPAVALHCNGTMITGALFDGKFPDWRKVVPTQVSGLVSQFDADYVATFGKINKLLGSKYSPAIAHNGGENGADGAARVLLTGDAIGVIIPMRCDSTALDYPPWLQSSPVPVAVAA